MYIDKFFDLIKVYDTPYTKVRMGRKNDGGYVIPPPIVTTYPNFSDVVGHYVNYKL